MKVVIIQNHPVFGQKEENIKNLFSMIDQKIADIYIMPELAYTGYQFTSKSEATELSDAVDSDIIEMFTKKAAEKDAALIFGFAEKSDEGVYNSSMMITPEGKKYVYRKTHLFYKERKLFLPGDTGFFVVDYRDAKIGMAICFDWFFSESFRTLALKGADIIAHCSNLVMPYCQQVDYARAIENRVFIFTVNRIGSENRDGEELTFTGESVAVSPKGEYLLRADKEKEEVISVDIDPETARSKFLNPYNHVIDDRRGNYYLK